MIPRILHLIWVGSPVPAWAARSIDRWREAVPPGWDVAVHTETPGVATRFALSPRCAADLLRLRVLYRHGGVYVDLDTVPLRPDAINDLAGERAPWIGRPASEVSPHVIANGALGFSPRHPLVALVWNHAMDQLRAGVRDDHHVAGPRSWAWAYARAHRAGTDVTLDPYMALVTSTALRRRADGGDLDWRDQARRHPAPTVILHIAAAVEHA